MFPASSMKKAHLLLRCDNLPVIVKWLIFYRIVVIPQVGVFVDDDQVYLFPGLAGDLAAPFGEQGVVAVVHERLCEKAPEAVSHS